MEIGLYLKQKREDLDLKQIYVAKKINIQQSTLSKIENDMQGIPFYILISLIKLYKIDFNELLKKLNH